MGALKRSVHTLVSNNKCAFKHDVVAGWNDVVPDWNDVVAGWNDVVPGWNDVVAGWNDVVAGWNDVVAGWNEQVKELHSAARDADWIWKEIGKPRQGNAFNVMKLSRIKFKHAIRKCKKDKEIIIADSIA